MHRFAPLAAAALVSTVLPTDALACGGFFCRNTPIDQSGEKIVFAMDEDANKVWVHVQVAFEGEAEDFAWVVPTPAQPDIELSFERLFTQLDFATRPMFQRFSQYDGECDFPPWRGETGFETDFDGTADTASALADSGGAQPSVTVVAQQAVGPYDTVTLQATSADALITWLQDNGYNVPTDLATTAAPYVASGSHFVALRLQNDRTIGDLRPFALTYPGREPVIPLVLTSVAATPDMPLEVYVMGEGRAIPTNYLHVKPNEAAIDWFSNGSNYASVVSAAANEAGGQAFATDFAGATPASWLNFWWPGAFDTSRLAGMTDLGIFMDELLFNQAFSPTDTLLDLLRVHVPMPQTLVDQGVSENDFYNCVDCYPASAGIAFDPVAFAADLDTYIVQPSRTVDELAARMPWTTRLTSSMSPAEMTVDPMFDINPDYEAVDRVRRADVVYDCTNGGLTTEVDRVLRLPSGREIVLPSEDWLADQGLTEVEWLAGLQEPAAERIEQMFTDRDPEPVVDNEGTVDDLVEDFNGEAVKLLGIDDPRQDDPTGSSADPTEPSGCGCDTTRGASGWLALVGLVGLSRRRR